MSKAQPLLDQNAEACEHTFCDSPIRSEVWQIADRIFSRGMRLVDIGCGTGEDAIHFASRGINVTAVDVSGAMIAQLKSKSGGAVRCEVADMRTCPVEDVFDGVFSNSSALNYVPDLDWLGHIRLTPGAHFVFTTLGRFYPLESAVFMFKGQPRRAFRRFKPSFRGEVPGVNFNVYYHSLRKIRNALGRGARLKLYPSTNDGSGSVQCEVYDGMVIWPRGAESEDLLQAEENRVAFEDDLLLFGSDLLRPAEDRVRPGEDLLRLREDLFHEAGPQHVDS